MLGYDQCYRIKNHKLREKKTHLRQNPEKNKKNQPSRKARIKIQTLSETQDL